MKEKRSADRHYEKPDIQILVFKEEDMARTLTVSNGIPVEDEDEW